ncbi:MAG: methyltransferase [archaeon]
MSHYYSEKQDSEFKLNKITEILRKQEYSFFTSSGVFSKKKVDFGTRVLVNNMVLSKKDRVLDLGCGIGIVGRVVADLVKEVVMTDVNERAVKLAKMNTKGLKNVDVIQGNMYEKVEGKFNVILLNPPQTAGKKICMEMIRIAKDFLVEKGNLQIVARHNKGGETLSKYMKEVYGNMETIVKQGGYRVYLSKA